MSSIVFTIRSISDQTLGINLAYHYMLMLDRGKISWCKYFHQSFEPDLRPDAGALFLWLNLKTSFVIVLSRLDKPRAWLGFTVFILDKRKEEGW